MGKPARALTLDVPGSPAAHGNAVKNPFTGEITVTENAYAVTAAGPIEPVSMTNVQPAPNAASIPPVPSRVSTIRSGSIGSNDTRSTSGAASVEATGSHVTVAGPAAATSADGPVPTPRQAIATRGADRRPDSHHRHNVASR